VLHPQSTEYLTTLAGLGLPHCVVDGTRPDLAAAELRALIEAAMRSRHADEEPIPMRRVLNLRIPGDHGQIPVRLYDPGVDQGSGMLVYFHGGGWTLGGLDSHDGYCRAVAAESGCLVAAVDYRLAPEHKFPAAVSDAFTATCWLAEHIEDYNGDPELIAVGGDSSGGNLAAVVAHLARAGGPQLAMQLLIYPVTDYAFDTASYVTFAEGFHLGREFMRWFWEQYLPSPDDGLNPLASPLRALNLTGLPPALIVTAECDPLTSEAAAYADRLRAAGVPVDYRCYPGMMHSFFTAPELFDAAKEGLLLVSKTLRRRFDKAQPDPVRS
jgi:acetyl esterase